MSVPKRNWNEAKRSTPREGNRRPSAEELAAARRVIEETKLELKALKKRIARHVRRKVR